MLHENCTLDILKSCIHTHTNHANTRKPNQNQAKRFGTKRTNKRKKKKWKWNGMAANKKNHCELAKSGFCYTNNTNDSVFSCHHPIDLFAYIFIYYTWLLQLKRVFSFLTVNICVYMLYAFLDPSFSRLGHTQNSHEIFINKHIVWHFASTNIRVWFDLIWAWAIIQTHRNITETKSPWNG